MPILLQKAESNYELRIQKKGERRNYFLLLTSYFLFLTLFVSLLRELDVKYKFDIGESRTQKNKIFIKQGR